MNNLAINISQIVESNVKILNCRNVIKALNSRIENDTSLLKREKKQIIYWTLRFLKFHNHQHPVDLVQTDIEGFLSSLATEEHYNHKLQKSAEKALMYLYNSFLAIPIKGLHYISVQQRKGYLSFFGEKICKEVVNSMSGKNQLMVELMILGNLKLSEVARLRESDVDIKKNRISIYSRDEKLLYTIIIPMKLVLDLRIQKLRIKQSFACYKQIAFNTRSNIHKNPFFFQTKENELVIGQDLKVAQIKQAFKCELKKVITNLNRSHSIKKSEYVDDRFNQLRRRLGWVTNASPIYHLQDNRQKNYQLELEVA